MNELQEITVEISKTIQEEQYEPLKVTVSLRKAVKPNEVTDEIRKTAEVLETEVAEILGID